VNGGGARSCRGAPNAKSRGRASHQVGHWRRTTCCCSPLAAHGARGLGGAPRTRPARSGRTGRRTEHADGVERASWRAATAAATWPCGRAAARRSGSSDVMQHSHAGEQQQHAGRVLRTPPRPRAPLTCVLQRASEHASRSGGAGGEARAAVGHVCRRLGEAWPELPLAMASVREAGIVSARESCCSGCPSLRAGAPAERRERLRAMVVGVEERPSQSSLRPWHHGKPGSRARARAAATSGQAREQERRRRQLGARGRGPWRRCGRCWTLMLRCPP